MPRKAVSLREFARIMGVTLRAVQDAIKYGRIDPNEDGKIDPVKCRRQWIANTNHAKRHRKKAKPMRPEPEEGPAAGNGSLEAASRSQTGGWNDARTRRENIQTKLLEMELEERSGSMVPVAEVDKRAFAAARRARDLLLAMPGQMGPELAGINDPQECTRRLEREVGRICDELAKYGKIRDEETVL